MYTRGRSWSSRKLATFNVYRTIQYQPDESSKKRKSILNSNSFCPFQIEHIHCREQQLELHRIANVIRISHTLKAITHKIVVAIIPDHIIKWKMRLMVQLWISQIFTLCLLNVNIQGKLFASMSITTKMWKNRKKKPQDSNVVTEDYSFF